MGRFRSEWPGLQKHHLKSIAFAGSASDDAGICNGGGLSAFFPIIRGAATLTEAPDPENARRNLMLTAEQVFRFINQILFQKN